MPHAPSGLGFAAFNSSLNASDWTSTPAVSVQVEAFLLLGVATQHSKGLVEEHFPTARELGAAGEMHTRPGSTCSPCFKCVFFAEPWRHWPCFFLLSSAAATPAHRLVKGGRSLNVHCPAVLQDAWTWCTA